VNPLRKGMCKAIVACHNGLETSASLDGTTNGELGGFATKETLDITRTIA
jgi:hypothetical protein